MSNEELVMQRLKVSLSEQIRKKLSPSIGSYAVIHGALLVPDPAQDEKIEGEICYLYQVATSSEGAIFPILIKERLLKYPKDFLHRISSKLVFYGEILPVPVSIVGQLYQKVLLVRVLAHLKD